MDYRDQTLPLHQNAVLASPNRLKLGIFCSNVQRGTTHTRAPQAHRVTWETVSAIAKAADQAGIEALIPLAQWKQVAFTDTETDRVLETFTWAAAVAAITSRIQVLATCHVPLYHPVMVAKQAATIDLISNGRFGLNIVAGWNTHDFAMFACDQKDHDDRYAVAAEWVSFLEKIWTTRAPFDFDGQFFRARGVVSEPKPIQAPRPLLMSAGFSPAGQDFAQRHADLNFVAVQDLAQARAAAEKVRTSAKEKFGRNVLVWCGGWVVCRRTRQEAEDFVDSVIRQQGDRVTAEATLAEMMPHSHSIRGLARETMLERLMGGFFGLPLIGTPEDIVARLLDVSEAGIDGVALSWVDYGEGLLQYTHELLPLLRDAGLRAA
jgi:alkanesulfonate monooxygenase SsuD/methylene tetrahydromethanopterin reductase-like flavin-dependent oxidoreductase (luciferase family)